jgi:hypothetical protein
MTDFPNNWWNEFDTLGEEEVSKRLGKAVWDAHKQVAARQWLEALEAGKARMQRWNQLMRKLSQRQED